MKQSKTKQLRVVIESPIYSCDAIIPEKRALVFLRSIRKSIELRYGKILYCDMKAINTNKQYSYDDFATTQQTRRGTFETFLSKFSSLYSTGKSFRAYARMKLYEEKDRFRIKIERA